METENIRISALLYSITGLIVLELAALVTIPEKVFTPMGSLGLKRLLEIAFFLFLFSRRPAGLSQIGLAKNQLVPGIKRGILWSAAFGLLVGVLFISVFLYGINPSDLIKGSPQGGGPGKLLLFLLVGAFIAPIAEEIFFRGILYGFLRQWGVAPALVVSTLLFVLIHPHPSYIQAVGGLLFAVSYEIEQKLMTPIIIHILGNTALVLWPLIF